MISSKFLDMLFCCVLSLEAVLQLEGRISSSDPCKFVCERVCVSLSVSVNDPL